MDILHQKPNTKRPAIVQAALSLFAERGFHGTSMRDIARNAGVQEAAIYRHFESKEARAREMFFSVYNQHCQQCHHIVTGEGTTKDKLRSLVRQEFTMAEDSPEAFVYLCENERMFFEYVPNPSNGWLLEDDGKMIEAKSTAQPACVPADNSLLRY